MIHSQFQDLNLVIQASEILVSKKSIRAPPPPPTEGYFIQSCASIKRADAKSIPS